MTTIDFLSTLEETVRDRLENPSEQSYTSRLVRSGDKRVAQKVGEEGLELALAAVAGDREETVNEAADLLYHVIVLLNSHGIGLTDVVECLRARHAPPA